MLIAAKLKTIRPDVLGILRRVAGGENDAIADLYLALYTPFSALHGYLDWFGIPTQTFITTWHQLQTYCDGITVTLPEELLTLIAQYPRIRESRVVQMRIACVYAGIPEWSQVLYDVLIALEYAYVS